MALFGDPGREYIGRLFGLGLDPGDYLYAQQNASRGNELAWAMQNVFRNETSAPEPPPATPPKAVPRPPATIIDMVQRPGEDDWSPVVDA